MFNVTLINKLDNDIKYRDVYKHMNETDANKVADRMNRLNTLIARKMGIIMKSVFVVTKDVK